jgi:aryl-alcohol dehydrogenase-like predicted oxidoreductase
MPAETPQAGAAGTVAIGADLLVRRMGFGGMRLTGPGIWGEPKNPDEARRVLRRAVELGVDFIDTADSYGPEVNENLIAATLAPYPPGLVIGTKGGLVRPGPDVWDRDARPEHLRAACEASLKRLRLERIDLYQLHAPDPNVPFDDSVGELAKLQREGKIRHVGLSNVRVKEIERARKLVTVVSVQNRFNVLEHSSDDVLDYCRREKIAFLPWAPLGSGRYAGNAAPGGALRRLGNVASRHGITVGQAALAWLLARSPTMLTIPGTASVAHLEENVAAASVRLSDEDMRELG